MTRRETNHATNAGLALRAQQVVLVTRIHRDVRQQRAKVVLKNKWLRVGWISLTPGTHVTRTEIARRIKRGTRSSARSFLLTLPWALSPVWRYQHPTAGQRIESAMRMLIAIK